MKRKIKRYYSDGKAKGHFNLDENSYINVCDIISSITDTSLELQFSGTGSYTDGKTINVPVMMPFSATHLPDEMTHYTFLEHELAHILFKTDVRNFDLFTEWFTKYSDNYLDAYFFSNNFDDKQIDEFWREWGIIDWSTILRRIFDRVECHRVEHNWGEVYPGSRIRFKELRKGLGKTHTEEELNKQIILDQNLSNTLLISRIYKDDILTKTATPSFLNTHENVVFCVERLTNVENQSSIATLIECKSIIKRWMPMLFLDMLSLMKKDIPISECSMTDPNQYTDEFDPNLNQVCLSVCGKPSPIDADGSTARRDHSYPGDDDSVMDGCKTEKLPETLRYEYLNEDYDDRSDELRQASASRQRDIMKKIKMTIDPETYEGIKSTSSKVIGKIMETDIFDTLANSDRSAMRNIDQSDVNKLTRFFASVRSKNKINLDEEGDSVDPEAYIQFKANNNMNEIFTNEDITQGLDVSIVIDLSGSMSSSFKLDLACKYAKTLYKALESLPNVVLKAWVFSGYDLNKNMGKKQTPVIEVDYSRLNTIDTDWDRAPFTHTWNAIAHVAYKMRGSSGKKLMIIISDGMPYDGADLVNGRLNSGYLGGRTSGSTRLPPNTFDCIKATRTAVEYSFLTGTKVYGIQISDSPKYAEHHQVSISRKKMERLMTAMFGPRKNWTVVTSIEDAKHHLITEVVKGVYRTLIT